MEELADAEDDLGGKERRKEADPRGPCLGRGCRQGRFEVREAV